MRKKGNLTDEEQSLWDRFTQKIKPLSANKKNVSAKPVKPQSSSRKRPVIAPPPEELPQPKHHPTISHRINRVRKVRIDARLDLHGFNLEQARLQLAKFLISCQTKRYLWVLVITGKGKPKRQDEEPCHAPTKKTLRDQVPQWLEETSLRSVVSAYSTAKLHDGGTGALYVRLKRLG